jgi:hypothetical protein
MSYYSNPTANAAIGSVDRELRLLKKWAKQIRKRRQLGLLTQEEIARAQKQFVGVYRRFLKEALEDTPSDEEQSQTAP